MCCWVVWYCGTVKRIVIRTKDRNQLDIHRTCILLLVSKILWLKWKIQVKGTGEWKCNRRICMLDDPLFNILRMNFHRWISVVCQPQDTRDEITFLSFGIESNRDFLTIRQTSPEISFLGSLEDSIFYSIARFFIRKLYCAATRIQWQLTSSIQKRNTCNIAVDPHMVPIGSTVEPLCIEQTWPL